MKSVSCRIGFCLKNIYCTQVGHTVSPSFRFMSDYDPEISPWAVVVARCRGIMLPGSPSQAVGGCRAGDWFTGNAY